MFDQGHAILIGVGSYRDNALADVQSTVADARALADALRDPRLCGMPADQVTLLHDAGATQAAILGSLATLAERAGEESTVWIVYGGHGEFDADGRYCLTAHDTQVAGGGVVPGSAVDHGALLDAIRRLRSRRVLLVLNACHAGAVPPSLGRTAPPAGANPPELLAAAVLGQGAGRVLITACRERQLSYIGAGKRTLFAEALLDGLRGPLPASQAGYLGVFDLYDHVFRNVSRQVRQLYGDQQEPEISLVRSTGPFAVALRQGGDESDAAFATAPNGPAVRLLSEEACQQALQQIQSGVHFGQRNSVRVTGDVAGGMIDKRAGVFIGGGSVQGMVVGVNYGQVQSYTSPQGTAAAPTLEQALAQIEQLQRDAQRIGDADLADDLEGLGLLLRAAAKARDSGNAARHQEKIRDAQAGAGRLAAQQPQAQPLATLCERLA